MRCRAAGFPSRRREGLSGSSASASPREPHPTPEPRHDRFTPERQACFLHHLATAGTVRSACLAAGISPQAAYVCRRRSARFAAGWDAALVLARDHAEAVLAERALEGVEEAVFYHGEEIARRRRFDARLLLAHLGRLDARATADKAARRRAGRFDELVAMIAGAAPDGLVAPEPWSREALEADPFLPPARAEHVARTTEGLGPRAYHKAKSRAGAEWDRWQARAAALVDGLAVGVGAAEDRAADPPACAPREFKSLGGASPGRAGDFALDPVNFVNFAAEPPGLPAWGTRRQARGPDAGRRPEGRVRAQERAPERAPARGGAAGSAAAAAPVRTG